MFVLDTDHLGVLQRQTSPQFGILMHKISQYPEASFFGANGMTVLTRNLADFVRVPNLTVEDWTI
jgi:hypothetical protein